MKAKIGRGTLWLGDCLKIMPKLKEQSFDMILCDLPYGTTACKWDSIIPFEDLWLAYGRLIKPKGAIVLTGSQPFTSMLIYSNPKWFRCEWIWRKNKGSNFACLKYQPFKEHESVLIFAKNSPYYYPIKQERSESAKKVVLAMRKAKISYDNKFQIAPTIRRTVNNAARDPKWRTPSSVQDFNVQRGLHPTQKPVKLFEYLIKTYTKPGQRVLDNCAGSGTTAVACENLERRWICIEKDPKYFQVAKNRIEESLR